MPQNKRMLFSERRQMVARFAQVLGHPARLRILQVVRHHRFLLRDEIVEFLPLASATVSQHLSAMMQAGVLQRTMRLGEVGYVVNEAGWQQAQLYIKEYFAEVAVRA